MAEGGSPTTLTTGQPLNYGYLWWISGGQSAADGAFYDAVVAALKAPAAP